MTNMPPIYQILADYVDVTFQEDKENHKKKEKEKILAANKSNVNLRTNSEMANLVGCVLA